jgi:phosphatidylglycerol lysyltransferase
MTSPLTIADPAPASVDRARTLLARHGGPSLSHMTGWRGNQHWFTPDGSAAVAYRVIGRVALTVGDAFGDPAVMPTAVHGFASFCAANRLVPCWYSVTERLADHAASTGWKLLQVAEEARIPLPELRFTGRRWQDVRTALNRARRDGVTADWVCYSRAPGALAAQIREVSAAWVTEKGVPEMAFTLGGVEELRDDAVRCLVAVDADGQVQAVTSWLPVHHSGQITGWTLDMMRRRPGSCNGLMEFLIATAALRFQQEGAQFVSLSGTPLARLGQQRANALAQRVLDRLGHLLEPVYGFRALLAFKAKFQPVYHPLYLAYPRPTALPGIALAIARAYLPGLTTGQLLRLAATSSTRGAA